MQIRKKNDGAGTTLPGLGRRELMKLGAGAILGSALAPEAKAAQEQSAAKQDAKPARTLRVSKAGYKNDANRASGNGPLDNTTRALVSYASSFSESSLTPAAYDALTDVMVDSIGCMIAGFESEPARISARIARTTQSDLKSTVSGYGVVTTPEWAAFANTGMLRNHDFNDNATSLPGGGGGHFSDMIPGILAMGEALHVSGAKVLTAVALGYEVLAALQIADDNHSNKWDRLYLGPAAAIAIGKVIGLNEDQLANALSLSLVPYLPLGVSHAWGPMSMWKGSHTAAAVRAAVFANLLAREGMTGPCQPFEGPKGLWDAVSGPYKKLPLPAGTDGRLAIQQMVFKRFPAEGGAQTLLEVIPAIREWTKVDEIASIEIEVKAFGEIEDPSKFDPRNTETADHSLPFIVSLALTDGDVYLSSFTPKRFLDDQGLRQLMDKITIRESNDVRATRITVRKKTGEELTKVAQESRTPMTRAEINAKFNRICAYKSVTDKDRDRIHATWANLRGVKDVAEAMRGLAHFGRPVSL